MTSKSNPYVYVQSPLVARKQRNFDVKKTEKILFLSRTLSKTDVFLFFSLLILGVEHNWPVWLHLEHGSWEELCISIGMFWRREYGVDDHATKRL